MKSLALVLLFLIGSAIWRREVFSEQRATASGGFHFGDGPGFFHCAVPGYAVLQFAECLGV